MLPWEEFQAKEARIMAYGPIVGEHHRDAMIGTRDNALEPTDIAASPDLGFSFGDIVQTPAGNRRVADASYLRPGVPTRGTIEMRDTPDMGRGPIRRLKPWELYQQPEVRKAEAVEPDTSSLPTSPAMMAVAAKTAEQAPEAPPIPAEYMPKGLTPAEEQEAALKASKDYGEVASGIGETLSGLIPRDIEQAKHLIRGNLPPTALPVTEIPEYIRGAYETAKEAYRLGGEIYKDPLSREAGKGYGMAGLAAAPLVAPLIPKMLRGARPAPETPVAPPRMPVESPEAVARTPEPPIAESVPETPRAFTEPSTARFTGEAPEVPMPAQVEADLMSDALMRTWRERQVIEPPAEYAPRPQPETISFTSEATPVSYAIINDLGGVMSKGAAMRGGKYKGNTALWDDAPALSSKSHAKIYNPRGNMPDVAASELFDMGLIREPTVEAMWRAVESESRSARGTWDDLTRYRQQTKAETAEAKAAAQANVEAGQRSAPVPPEGISALTKEERAWETKLTDERAKLQEKADAVEPVLGYVPPEITARIGALDAQLQAGFKPKTSPLQPAETRGTVPPGEQTRRVATAPESTAPGEIAPGQPAPPASRAAGVGQPGLGTPRPGERPPPVPGAARSKIGKSIEAKAVEAKLTEGFADTAGYDPITIADQAARASELVRTSPENARAIVRGDAPLPEGLRGTSLITAMEERLLKSPDSQVAYELANSPLTSATSAAAQEMRLMAERVPDSMAAKFAEIRTAREAGAKQRGELKKTAKSIGDEIKAETRKVASKPPAWEAFVREITCA